MGITVNLAWQNIDASIDAAQASDAAASSISELYIVTGTTDDMAAIRAAYNYAPPKKEGLVKSKATIDTRATEDTWKIRVEYTEDEITTASFKDEDRKYTGTFSIGGGTQHIETSLATVGEYWDTSVYPSGSDYPGCIEPDIDGNPRGLDIPSPVFKFAETHVLSSSKVSTAYKRQMAYATRCMNQRTFRGFESGEVLFLGVTGYQEGGNLNSAWNLTFEFAVQQNQSNIKVGNITVPAKFGWDYLWKQIESRTNTEGKVFKKTTAVFVERIYVPIDFSVLGIGG